MLVALLLGASPPQGPSAAPPVAHICWIDRVVAEGDGVRVFYRGREPVDGEHASVGQVLTPANSGHDLCAITVERRKNTIGVWARASIFFAGPMTKPQESCEWIPAEAAR